MPHPVRSQSAGDRGRMPGHIAPTLTMSLIHDLPRRRRWRFQRSAPRFTIPPARIRSFAIRPRTTTVSESNPGRKRPLGPSSWHQASSQRPKPSGSVNSVQPEGTLRALAGGVGDMIHWASKRTPNPWDARSREAKLSLIVQPGEESMRESRSGTLGNGISVTASGNSGGVRAGLVHAS